MIWKCHSCGKCCESVKNILPDFALKSGACCHLDTKTRKCGIYFERPLICRVDKLYETNMKYFVTKDQYYAHQKMVCELTREK